jgi:hypothetical protein
MRVMLRVRAALHIRKVLLILALKRSFESLRCPLRGFFHFSGPFLINFDAHLVNDGAPFARFAVNECFETGS